MKHELVEVRPAHKHERITVTLPDKSTMVSTHVGLLDIPNFRQMARTAHVFPDLRLPLISVALLCDNGYDVLYTNTQVTVYDRDNGDIVIQGNRSKTTSLWDLPMHQPPQQPKLREHHDHMAANVIRHETNAERVAFYHLTFGSPPLPTLENAIRLGYIRNIPGLTLDVVQKNRPTTLPTAQGHLDRNRQNQRSTKPQQPRSDTDSPTSSPTESMEDIFPTPASPPSIRSINQCTTNSPQDVYVKCQHITGQMAADLTGRFPQQSFRGNEYMLIFYSYDTNYIHVEPLPNRKGTAILAAYKAAIDWYTTRGIPVKLLRMDNETSKSLEDHMRTHKITVQYVPPENHRANEAERAIRTWKNHFISTLCGMDPACPLAIWDYALEQAEITLNLMRGSRTRLKTSAYEHVCGVFDFNKTPLVPIGTQVLAYESPHLRATWAAHGVKAYYIGPAMQHYRCYTVWIVHTGKTRITDTLAFFPKTYRMPGSSVEDILTASLTDAAKAITAYGKSLNLKGTYTSPSTHTHGLRAVQRAIYEIFGDPHDPSLAHDLLQNHDNSEIPQEQRVVDPVPVSPTPLLMDDTTEDPLPTVPVTTEDATAATLPTVPVTTEGATAATQTPQPLSKAKQPRKPKERRPLPAPGGTNITYQEMERRMTRQSQHEITQQLSPRPIPSSPSQPLPLPPAARVTRGQTSGNQRTTRWTTAGIRPIITQILAALQPPTGKKTPSGTPHFAAHVLMTPTADRPSTLEGGDFLSTYSLTPHVPSYDMCSWQDTFQNPNQSAVDLALATVLMLHREKEHETPHTPEWFDTAMHNAHMANSVTDPETGKVLKYVQLKKGTESQRWLDTHTIELRKLLTDTNTMHFVHSSTKPATQKATYYNPQCEKKMRDGDWLYRIRGTAGGDKLDYTGETSSQTADMQTVKAMANVVVSEPNSKFMCVDITDFFLNTKLHAPEYMWISLDMLPPAIQEQYEVHKYADGSKVMVQITGGIYGLKQAALLAHQRLEAHLARHGYHPTANTPCLYRHKTRDVTFTLVVDDFGIKYSNVDDANHLLSTLRELYAIRVDWTGTKYLGITFAWEQDKVTLSMPGYVQKALGRFDIAQPKHAVNSPANPPAYVRGPTQQLVDDPDTSAPLDTPLILRLMQIVGVMLYYARTIDATMLPTVTQLSSRQANPTHKVMEDCMRLMDYAATWPNATIIYYKSDLSLHVDSDASYLSEPNARSRAGGFFYLSSLPQYAADGSYIAPLINGALLTLSTILDVVVSSATEAEYGALFTNSKEAARLRNILNDFGYTQTITPIRVDNKAAVGIANDTVKQKRSKAVDMRYHWIRDRVRQQQFKVCWKPGTDNLADFFTKRHPVKHFQSMRKFYVTDPSLHRDDARGRYKQTRLVLQTLQQRKLVSRIE